MCKIFSIRKRNYNNQDFFPSSNFHFKVQLRLMAIGHCKSVQKITSFTSDVGGVHFSLVMADLTTLVF